MTQIRPRRSGRLALALLLAGLVAATFGGFLQFRQNRMQEQQAFDAATAAFMGSVQARMQRYEYGVRGARGAVIAAGGERIGRVTFQNYMQTRDLTAEFPGARGFGFIRRVATEELPAFLAAARSEDRPGFALRELGPNDSERWVIQYIEPEAANGPAVGLDIASNPERRQAALAAMETGETRITAPIDLVQDEGDALGGFLLLAPAYAPDARPGTPAERREAAIGWAYAPLVASEVLAGIGNPGGGLAIRLSDVGADGQSRAFFAAGQAPAGALSASLSLPMFGREWRVECAALPGLVGRPTPPWLVSAALLLAAALLAAIAWVVGRGSERRRELQERQAALTRDLVDVVPYAVLVVDAKGRIVQANRRVADVFGYSQERLLGSPVDQLLPAARRAAHVAQRDSYDHTDRPMGARSDLWALHADGHEFPVEINLNSLLVNGERLVVAGVLDVTERRAARLKLEQSEARWREMANSQPQLVWTCAADGACDFLSQRWVDYTGIPEAQQLGSAWLEQVHPEDRPRLARTWQAAVDSNTAFQEEFRIRRHDGVYRWFHTLGVLQLDEQGRKLRWIGSNTDIEARRQAEDDLRTANVTLESRVAARTAELERARGDLQSILDALPSMIGYWDRDLRNRFANHAYQAWFGVDPQTLPGKTLPELLGPDLFENNRVYVEAALRGEPQRFERSIGSRHSEARYIPDVVDGEVRGFYAFVSDVTELSNALQAAEAASSAKSVFLANMSHEIRTPMNAVMNLCYLLEQGRLDPEQRELLSKMRIASRSLLGLINDVLDLSKIEAGQMGLAAEVFSLRTVIDEALQLCAPQAEPKGVALLSDLADDLPPFVRGDSLRLNQVLSNLLSNAIKFTERGHVRLEGRVEGRDGEFARLRFAVIDTGIGIPAEAQPLLFEPFVQADASTTRRFGGSGLGLAIVKRLVALMGGEVGLTSEVGQGSCFWFCIRLRVESEATLSASSPGRLEMLIADDSADERQVLANSARSLGWTVEAVESGNSALDRILDRQSGGRPYDVLLIDWRMPGLDGLETLAELRRRLPGPYASAVILVTAQDPKALSAIPGAAFADAILAKPIDASTLFDTVHRAVARHAGSSAPLAIASGGFSPSERLRGMRILLVDDSTINLDVGQRILSRAGAEVVLAGDGQAALDRLKTDPTPFDAVLMDVQMPVLDGHEATRRIRGELGMKELPVIALTAGALVSERQRAEEAGMTSFVSKPFDAERLIELLAAIPGPRLGRVEARPQDPAPTGLKENAPIIEGINMQGTYSLLGGDWNLLRGMLQRLFDEFSGGWPSDPDALDAHARERLAQRAHKLRGVAGNVGADTLRSLAGRLETDARNPLASRLADATSAVLRELPRLRAACEGFLAAGVPEVEPPAAALDLAALDMLLVELRRQSLDALERYKTLRPALRAPLGEERLAALDHAMQLLGFAEALKLLEGLAERRSEADTETS